MWVARVRGIRRRRARALAEIIRRTSAGVALSPRYIANNSTNRSLHLPSPCLINPLPNPIALPPPLTFPTAPSNHVHPTHALLPPNPSPRPTPLRYHSRHNLHPNHAAARPAQSPAPGTDRRERRSRRRGRGRGRDLALAEADGTAGRLGRVLPGTESEPGGERGELGLVFLLVSPFHGYRLRGCSLPDPLGGVGRRRLAEERDGQRTDDSCFRRYALFKARMDEGEAGKLSAGQHLLASAESGSPSAPLPPPLPHGADTSRTCRRRDGGDDQPDLGSQDPHVHLSGRRPARVPQRLPSVPLLPLPRPFPRRVVDLLPADGISQLARKEGIRGLSKGMVLALVGVSNGAQAAR